jgi:hypothetical protein
MNQKTAKLLKRYANQAKTDANGKLDSKAAKSFYKELKVEWDRLNAEQRRKRRNAYSEAVRAAAVK